MPQRLAKTWVHSNLRVQDQAADDKKHGFAKHGPLLMVNFTPIPKTKLLMKGQVVKDSNVVGGMSSLPVQKSGEV